jgi:hypothetical protein
MNEAARAALSIRAFEAAAIDADAFDHESHVYLAWLYVQEFDLAHAIARFDAALRRLTAKLGATGKYHATITWLFLLLISERREDGENWAAFRRRNSDLFDDSRSTLRRYYSEDRLFSDRARRQFVLPDRVGA